MKKPVVRLLRFKSSDEGTFSMLMIDGRFFCYTAELPWRGNKTAVSCIPAGRYECEMVDSPKYGRVYGVKAVPGRSHILIHAGNWAGDTSKGYKSNSNGCILLGSSVGEISGQEGVASSRFTLGKFEKFLNSQPFILQVQDCYE